VSLTKHAPFDFPIINETFVASLPVFVFASEMLGMIAVTRVRHCTRAFDRPSAIGRSTQRVVRLVIVVVAERLSVEDVECLVGERFLHQELHGKCMLQEIRTEKPHMASVTVKAVSVVFSLELSV
jgi:hypothetical protein